MISLPIAARKTERLILNSDLKLWTLEGELSIAHQLDMCKKLMCRDIIGEKGHRWLGWLQAATVANGVGDLKVMKDINRASKI